MIAIYLLLIVLCTVNAMKAERPVLTVLWSAALVLNLAALYSTANVL